MVINNNIPALFSHLSMLRADRNLSTAMQRLSSGLRINSARDDAAGLAIANKLSYQVTGLERASDNATHGISLIQTAEGAMNEIHNMLQRMRELAVQSANDNLTNDQREMIQVEINQLTDEISQISSRTEFNRMRILNGEADRVTETWTGTGGARTLTRSMVSTIFLSPAVQPGQLQYQINDVGRHAVQSVALPPNLNAPAAPVDEYIIVNGTIITVKEGETWGDVLSNLNTVLNQHDITLDGDGTSMNLITNQAGSDRNIRIAGNDDLLAGLLGLPPGGVDIAGTDATIYIHGLMDANGSPVAGSNALTATTRGNQIFVRGPQGEDIRLNIQVSVNPANGDHYFGRFDPVNPANNTAAPTPLLPGSPADPALGVRMDLDIRNFGPIMLQIGPSHNTAMPVQIPRMNSDTLGLTETVAGTQRRRLNYKNGSDSQAALSVVDRAVETVSVVRARLGAYQNRLESTVRSLDVAAENTEMSRSRIQDADVPRESTRFAQYNVVFQAAMAILGQANQRPMQLISLLN